MAHQGDLDFTPPRTHAGDPASSHYAEAKLRRNGRLNRQQQLVLEWVAVTPGSTAIQITERITEGQADRSGMAWENTERRLYQVRRRLSDLKAKERVRRCHVKGDRESRWFPASE